MTASRLYVGSIFLSLILSGCIPIPTFEGEPYSDEISNLKVGITTKNNVLDLLGEPGATFSRESEFVYTDYQSEVVFIGPNVTMGQLHFLVLSFNENDVLGDYFIKSAPPDSHGCIDSGWCASQKRAFRLADKSEDTKAKQFVAGNQCGIYLYGRFQATISVTLDGKDMGFVFGKRHFQHWKIIPGSHEIAQVAQPGISTWGMPEFPSLSIDCVGGEIVFIKVNSFWGYSLERERDDAEGREQIRKRHLAIPGRRRKIPDS